MTPKQRERIIASLEWMITDLKWHTDQTRLACSEADVFGMPNEYSPELTEAINLLSDLKAGKE